LYDLTMNGEWEEPYEEDGITLGPEEALQREIQKSKSLKVDKLQLRNEVEKLQIEVRDLTVKLRLQEQEIARIGTLGSGEEKSMVPIKDFTNKSIETRQIPRFLVVFILFFNILAISLLLYFKLQK
jgi:hypothetical protein